jgi:hypothetical protein
MGTNVVPIPPMAEKLERALIGGDLAQLSAPEKIQYYNSVCQSLGLNPLTKPFAYIRMPGRNGEPGKEVLYALKDCTEQLRNIHAISLTIPARELMDDVYVVTARASRPDGRVDESTGAVTVGGIKGEAKANAMMKAETKAKRRVTLSICGLGMLDETEIETIPAAQPAYQKFTKEEVEAARAEQQAIAKGKIEQIQTGTVPESWDWRIALPRFEKLEQQYGKTEVSIALKMAGFNSLEETPTREAALAAYEKVRATLAKAATEQPEWVDKPHAKPESTLEKASGPVGRIASHIVPAKPSDPVQEMLERMRDFKSRLAVIQQHKFDLVQKYGQKDGERRYYEVLDKQGGHPDTHANEIAKNAEKSRATASELYLELHPEAVEEEVNA